MATPELAAEQLKQLGASPAAIERHYDVGDEFYELWLDPTLTYTCASWAEGEGPAELEAAQTRKIDLHARNAEAAGARSLLDVGCGWGGLLRRMVEAHRVGRAVGLSLSRSQAERAARPPDARVEVRVEHWADHEPPAPYDAIVSVEALEAFARDGLASEQKLAVYREFFRRCHAWLLPGRRLSLQFIAYGNSGPEDLDGFVSAEIFPESDLPRLSEVLAACERLFEVVELRNDRADYVRTLDAWLAGLTAQRQKAAAAFGAELVERYVRYLRLSRAMFQLGSCDLFRLALRRIDRPRR